MNKSTILETKKGVSNIDLLAQIEAGKEGHFPLSKQSTIKPMISSRLKDKFPDRVFETDTKSISDIIIVRRIK